MSYVIAASDMLAAAAGAMLDATATSRNALVNIVFQP